VQPGETQDLALPGEAKAGGTAALTKASVGAAESGDQAGFGFIIE